MAKQFTCKTCRRRFAKTWQLAQHVRKTHKHGSYKRKSTKPAEGKTEAQILQAIKDYQPRSRHGQDRHIAFLFGSISKELDLYASRTGVPRSTLASGLAEILQGEASR